MRPRKRVCPSFPPISPRFSPGSVETVNPREERPEPGSPEKMGGCGAHAPPNEGVMDEIRPDRYCCGAPIRKRLYLWLSDAVRRSLRAPSDRESRNREQNPAAYEQ